MRLMLAALAVFVATAGTTGSLMAHPAFKTEFDKRYLKKDGAGYSKALFDAYKGRSSCNVCHIGGTDDRKMRNAFGNALSKHLKVEDKDNLGFKIRTKNKPLYEKTLKKVAEAFETVEKLPAQPDKKDAPSFGSQIKDGSLPVSPKELP